MSLVLLQAGALGGDHYVALEGHRYYRTWSLAPGVRSLRFVGYSLLFKLAIGFLREPISLEWLLDFPFPLASPDRCYHKPVAREGTPRHIKRLMTSRLQGG